MKYLFGILIILFSCFNNLGVFTQNSYWESLQAGISTNKTLSFCLFLELSSGPELNMIERGFGGAITEECIKAIEQNIVIIATSNLLKYLQLLIEKKLNKYEQVKENLKEYLFFQTQQNNFVVLIPKKNFKTLETLGFSNSLKLFNLSTFANPLINNINLEELKSIFATNSVHNLSKSIYFSGHGTPSSWNEKPTIGCLTLDQYKIFICFLNEINCKFLFVSSCFAAGLNMISVHTDLLHRFPIVAGNLTDSFCKFYPTINFKKYFYTLDKELQNIDSQKSSLFSENLKKAIKKICGNSVNNIPWIKLPDSEKFLIFNENNHLIMNDKNIVYSNDFKGDEQNTKNKPSPLLVKDNQKMLMCSTEVTEKLKISSMKLPEIISIIPGQSHHIFNCVKLKNHTLYDLVDCILKVNYEFTKVFLFKKVKIRKPKRKFNKFKIITLKNILIINYGYRAQNSNYYKSHELYFQKGDHYNCILIPEGTKIGYLEIESDIFPLEMETAIIDYSLQISKPSDYVLKSIGKFI